MSNEKIEYLNLDLLHPFENNPFQSVDESEYDELRDSVMEFGIITPLIVNKSENGYEIISGHRRWQIAKELKLDVVPVYVREFSKEEAVINFVDCNLSREKILPSEKARAYKMKHDAIKKQGARTDLTSSQVGTKFRSDEMLAETMPDSRMQIQRYIRLTNLIDPILQMVDDNQIAMNAAVELSYLGSKEQAAVMQSIEKEDTSPSIAQAKKIRKFHQDGKLNEAVIDSIMMEQKPETIKITLGEDKLKKYFPKSYTKAKMEEIILKLLDKWHRQRENEKER